MPCGVRKIHNSVGGQGFFACFIGNLENFRYLCPQIIIIFSESMKKIIALALLFSATAMSFAQMSDDQVVQFAKRAYAAGKSQTEIAAELAARGVTMAQVERIRAKYEGSGISNYGAKVTQRNSRMRESRSFIDEDPVEKGKIRNFKASEMKPVSNIYGHNLFNNASLTFEPNENVSTPENYRLGPGDEVIIDVWGASESTTRSIISPEGSIQVTGIGPIYLNGMTVASANQYIQKQFSRIYSDLEDGVTSVQLTLGNTRSIQINIMGEIAVPGTYTLSPFSSVFHALYMAGGINDIGTVRNIKVVRGGKSIATVDVYKILLEGKMQDNIRLLEGDVILVDTYKQLVTISGNVKRPMRYEMKEGERLQQLIDYAGGYGSDAYRQNLELVRQTGAERQIFTVDQSNYTSFTLCDGDAVTVGNTLDRFQNRITINGAVFRPGSYELDSKVNSVKTLIQKADGLRENAYLDRAVLTRETADLEQEVISVDLNGIMNGSSADIRLQKNDQLYISTIQGLRQTRNVIITGEVASPGTFPYAENMKIGDLIVMAGGLTEQASTVGLEIARRIKDPQSTDYSATLSETFSYDLSGNGTSMEGNDYVLQPFDVVNVRRSPGYQVQRTVTISGEILRAGSYTLKNKNERVSSLVERAGGLTPESYVKGARLIRRMNRDELEVRVATIKAAQRITTKKDSTDFTDLGISPDQIDDFRIGKKNVDSIAVNNPTYTVGIDLQRAIDHPGTEDDFVLREGDELIIPEKVSTVKISGAVLFPNTVAFEKGKSFKYYIANAGGYNSQARKSQVYVVYMNGKVASRKQWGRLKIEPGCEIVVPSKPEKEMTSLAEKMAVASTTTSMAAAIAAIISVVK